MLSLEGYIARRKKEDRMDEFDLDSRLQNMKTRFDYVFEFFQNYLPTTAN